MEQSLKSIRVIITGTTGMVGEGVMLECLSSPLISEVLSVSRKHNGHSHPKLKEYIVPDFLSLKEGDPMLKGYDACFYCAGVSSVGMKEEKYRRITYDTTIHFAKVLSGNNAGMTFIYVSGGGTDSTEKGRLMWARVKGKTENDLMKLPFRKVHNFRPGVMKPVPGQKYVLKMYNYLGWLFPVIRKVFPNAASTLSDVARAMMVCATSDVEKSILEVSDINSLGRLRKS